MNSARLKKADAKVATSMRITTSSPPNASTAEAAAGVRTVTSAFEKDWSPLTRWNLSRGARSVTVTSEAGC